MDSDPLDAGFPSVTNTVISHYRVLHPLGEGWQYTVPRWIATTPDGIVIEDNGVPPDVAIRFDPADFAKRVDVTLDSALVLARRAGGG